MPPSFQGVAEIIAGGAGEISAAANRAHSPMGRSGMQYRTPGRTLTIEVPSGHSRIGHAARGVGWLEDSRLEEAPQSLLMQGGGTVGVSMCRSRIGKPIAKTLATSTTENTG